MTCPWDHEVGGQPRRDEKRVDTGSSGEMFCVCVNDG
jgi:hypothetical protein